LLQAKNAERTIASHWLWFYREPRA
jgi:hypothetical protein